MGGRAVGLCSPSPSRGSYQQQLPCHYLLQVHQVMVMSECENCWIIVCNCRERAEVEREYAKSLRKLSIKYTSNLSQDDKEDQRQMNSTFRFFIQKLSTNSKTKIPL